MESERPDLPFGDGIHVGFFDEFFAEDGLGTGPLAACRRGVPYHDRSAILAYLDSGEVVATWAGTALDPVDGVELPVDVLTDGVYIWTSLLAHYVRRLELEIPEPLLGHIRTKYDFRPSS